MKSLLPIKDTFRMMDKSLVDFYKAMDDFFKDKWISEKEFKIGSFKLDVKDNENEYVVEAELPGYKKEEISVDVTNETLNISAKKEEKKEEKKENYIHKERRYESVSRSIYLDGAKAEGVKAKLDNGILAITIPKEVKEEPKNKVVVE